MINKMNIQINQNEILIAPGYRPEIIEKIKSVPDGRRYDPATKTWHIVMTADNLRHLMRHGANDIFASGDLKKIERLIDDTTTYFDAFQNYIDQLKELIKKIEKPLRIEKDFLYCWGKIEPFNHQITGLNIIIHNNRVALHWEQGLGKTLPMILLIKELQRNVKYDMRKKSLIVCPKNVMRTWQEQFKKFSYLNPVLIIGSTKKRSQLLFHQNSTFIINYDVLYMMQSELIKKGFNCIVFDESQYIKNPYANRSKAAYEIAKNIPYRYELTGTPIGNGTIDIFQQFKILDESIFGTSFYSFRNKYFEDKSWSFKSKKTGKEQTVHDWKIKPEMIPEIRHKIGLRAQRLTKADCLDLPDKLYQKLYIEMTGEQKQYYREALSQLKIVIDDREINTRQKIVKMMRLNQICSGHLGSGENIATFNHNKLKELRRLWEDAGCPKLVVWTVFTHDIFEIMKEFQNDINVLSIFGGNPTTLNDENRQLFQEDDGCKIIVCNERAGGVGITLTAAALSVYYSHSYSLLSRLQSEARVHRIGQDKNVTYIDLVAENSIEEDIIAALEAKRQLAADLLGDNQEIGFMKEIIKRLR